MTQRNQAGWDAGAGEVFVECAEQTEFPGFGLSGQGENCPLRGRRRLPTRKLHRGGSMDGGGSGLNRTCESKMEILAKFLRSRRSQSRPVRGPLESLAMLELYLMTARKPKR
jgi:hypothetical protein